MIFLLIDTCVWLDLAKSPRQLPLIEVLDELSFDDDILIVLPDVVRDEFKRHRDRVVRQIERSLTTSLKEARRTISMLHSDVPNANDGIDKILSNTKELRDAAEKAMTTIEDLHKRCHRIRTTKRLLTKAAERAVKNIVPFHRDKNSIVDAMLIEIALELASPSSDRVFLVTTNTTDFSDPNGSNQLPHPQLASVFDSSNIAYRIDLAQTINEIRPGSIADAEQFLEEVYGGLRATSEIYAAIDEFFDRVWYDRHQLSMSREGAKDIPKRGFEAARELEAKYGAENLGPYDKFEWGMINGKLSALRWVTGYEWDMLDT